LRDLTSRERRTMLACWGGWTLDGFDQQLYSCVVPTVIAVWGMSTGAAGTIGTVTVVTSSFGGRFAGARADRFGRVRVLQIAILWYSVFTFLRSFAQNFEQLFILRGLHGPGFGGEWATGAVLMGEVIRDKYRSRGVGFVQTGAAAGPGLAALVYAGLFAILPEAIAWRALFAVGILPALLVLRIRRSIPESEAFEERRAARDLAPALGVSRVVFMADDKSVADGHGRTGRRLGGQLLDADLSAHGAPSDRHRHRALRRGSGVRGADRVPARRLSGGRDRSRIDVHDLGHRDDHHGARLFVRAGRRQRSAAPRDPSKRFDPDEVRGDGPVYDGALSDRHPRHRPGLFLQCLPDDRLGVYDRDRFLRRR
jgi:hypothetical protein